MIEISATEHLNTETAGKTLNFLDAGTTWSKILTVENGVKSYKILPTSQLKTLDIEFVAATGHSAQLKNILKYENEVVALACGAKKWLKIGRAHV